MRPFFENRVDAGNHLARSYSGPRDRALVLGIPRGGIPVGYSLARAIGGHLDTIVVRKLPIPHNPEAGFGAVAPDGSLVLNQDMLSRLRLSPDTIEEIAADVLEEVLRREKAYRGDRPFPDLEDANVILTDDGLATGYTMIAAIKMVREKEPRSVTVAVPVSPVDTARRIEPLADHFFCLHVSHHYPFAVASFYQDFHDLSDDEVGLYLEDFRFDGLA
jgi:putative phosphoribosyl transferase